MKAVRMLQGLAIVVTAACGDLLGISGDRDVAGIYWTEASSTPDEVAVRVLGLAGCAGLEELRWHLRSEPSPVLELDPRAGPKPEHTCIVPARFDRTITFRPPSDARALIVREAKPGQPSRDLVVLDLRSPHRKMGGWLTVDRKDALCTTASPGFDLVHDPWYSVFTARAHPWKVGEFVQVEGYVDADPWATCGLEETMIITRITYNPD